MAAAPGKVGVTVLPVAGIVVGLVETYSSVMLVIGAPLVSVTVATRLCVMFWFTLMGTVGAAVEPGTVSTIDCGGQVEKKPAELDDC